MRNRVFTATAVSLLVAVALAGCSGSPKSDDASAKPTATKSASATPKPTPTKSSVPTKTTAPTSTSKNLSFEDGAKLDASKPPAWGIVVSGLKDWKPTKVDPTKGQTEYTKSDGTVAVVTQQYITDLDPNATDLESTQRIFTAAGYPADQLEAQLLPTVEGGTADFLSIGGSDSTTGKYVATVARAFSKPKSGLIIVLTSPDAESFKADLHELLINAQVVRS